MSQNNEVVELLIKAGADVNGNDYGCPLNIAFEYGGNREIIKTLVNNGADVNVCPYFEGPYWAQYNNILEIAVARGDAELVELFIEKGLSPDSVIGDAIYTGDKKIVKILLNNGVKSLHCAAFIGDIELAKSFLDEGFDINEKIVMGSAHEYSEYTPLDCAKMGGNEDMIEFLMSNTEPVLESENIYQAVENGDILKVEEIIQNNPEIINIKNDEYSNYTPLMVAAECGNKKIVELLLEYGADINAVDNNGYTPLRLAAASGYKKICQLLIEKGADINSVDEYGCTPLHLAAEIGKTEICQLLIEKGADINAVDNNGFTPLRNAAIYGYKEICQLLIEKGADVNAVDNLFGSTPLHCAAANGNKKICQLLLEKGADINAVDNDGKTPLDDAAFYGQEEIYQLLLEKKADINKVDED